MAPVRVVMNGDRLDIQASVDLEGLKKLQVMLEKYQGILEMSQPETKEAANRGGPNLAREGEGGPSLLLQQSAFQAGDVALRQSFGPAIGGTALDSLCV